MTTQASSIEYVAQPDGFDDEVDFSCALQDDRHVTEARLASYQHVWQALGTVMSVSRPLDTVARHIDGLQDKRQLAELVAAAKAANVALENALKARHTFLRDALCGTNP